MTESIPRRIGRDFYLRDVLELAPSLLGCTVVIPGSGNTVSSYTITETEAYRGEEDKSCHAFKGRTKRTEVMYHSGGMIYMYFVYGMYWMMNIVAAEEGNPQAVLIRGVRGISGPGRFTKAAGLDGSFYGVDLDVSERIWLLGRETDVKYITLPRVGINYAGEPWVSMKWRYIIA